MKPAGQGRLVSLTIDNLNSEGQGVARLGRDVYFVPGALVGEQVSARLIQRSKKIWHTRLVEILSASSDRQEPECPHYQKCGGCDLQHMHYDAQVEMKQARIAREFQRQKVDVAEWSPALTSQPWGYRRKARLGVRHSKEQGQTYVGFREGASKHLTNIDHCKVLPEHPALSWADWREVLSGLHGVSVITQIEPVWADNALSFLIRVLKPLSDSDLNALSQAFERWSQDSPLPLELWCRSEKHGAPERLWPATDTAPLHHEVDGLKLRIQPDDFIQVNRAVNQAMVAQALAWLDVGEQECVWDLFAGHGNFSMPLAQRCSAVVAVEGQQGMVDSLAAQSEKLALPLQAKCADLATAGALSELPEPDAVLLDPPRAGAAAVMPELIQRRVSRVLYVSCDPATLARDLNQLVNAGYEVINAGMMDMFPQTHHVETMVLLRYRGK